METKRAGTASATERPCQHMRRLVERSADGSLGRLGTWYLHIHTAGCLRCSHALASRHTVQDEPQTDGSPDQRNTVV